MQRHPHLLNAATNLLGFSFVIIGALKLTNSNARSYADECAWAASVLFLAAIVCSYSAIRRNATNKWLNVLSDGSFFGGLTLLTASLAIGATIL
jgi:cytochrome bd-type quinol oxidase subunit 2